MLLKSISLTPILQKKRRSENRTSLFVSFKDGEYGCFSASEAAARSLSQSLRAEFRASGLRVMNVYTGPTEDEWYQPLPPPKVMPEALARSVVQGLQQGLEDTYCGDVAKDLFKRFRDNPMVLERETTLGGEGA